MLEGGLEEQKNNVCFQTRNQAKRIQEVSVFDENQVQRRNFFRAVILGVSYPMPRFPLRQS